MNTSFYDILGMLKQDMILRFNAMDVTSNNLGNVNTAGFKSSRTNFQELLGAVEKGGSQIVSTQLNQAQGVMQLSTNSLDLAVEGEGFFSVRLPDNRIAYTRDGRFRAEPDGSIVNASGYRLVWEGSVLQDTNQVEVDENGAVRGLQGTEWVQMGNIGLTRFTNPSGLQAYGDNLWLVTENSGAAQAGAPDEGLMGKIRSYAYEASNVNTADELTRLISLQRGMQVTIRTFQQTDTMIQQALRMRG